MPGVMAPKTGNAATPPDWSVTDARGNGDAERHENRGFLSGDPVRTLMGVGAIPRGAGRRSFLFPPSLDPPEPETMSAATVATDPVDRGP